MVANDQSDLSRLVKTFSKNYLLRLNKSYLLRFNLKIVYRCFCPCDILSSTWVEIWILKLRNYNVQRLQKLNENYQTLNNFEFIMCFWLKLAWWKYQMGNRWSWITSYKPYENLFVQFFSQQKILSILINLVTKSLEA